MRIATLILLFLSQPVLLAGEKDAFCDHGVVAAVSEKRGALAYQDSTGQKWLFVVLRDTLPDNDQPRISLLAIEPESGKTKQIYTGAPNRPAGDSFTLMMSNNGTLYWWSGPYLNRLEVVTGKHSFDSVIGHDELAMAMAEGENGAIYFATYPRAELYRLSPQGNKAERLVRLDEEEKYPIYLATSGDGWLYAGLGTQRAKIVAYHAGDKTPKTLEADAEPRFRISAIIRETNGAIKGRLGPGEPWFLLEKGAIAEKTTAPVEIPYPPNSMYWNKQQLSYPDGSAITHLDLSKRTYRWVTADGVEKQIAFSYKSEGASITAIGAASDGNLYGSTSHPMQLWTLRAETDKAESLGGIPLVGGGNLKGFIPWKNHLVANEYSRGRLFLFDPARPFDPSATADSNPALLATSHPHMSRPRALLIHSDGRHAISSGFPHYGRVAGRMVVYNLETRRLVAEVEDKDLAPGESIIALAELPGGDIAFGTSIRTPGGAAPVSREAKIGIYSLAQRKTLFLDTPIPGSEEIVALACDGDRLLGMTTESTFFTYNLKEKKLKTRRSLKTAGRPANRSGGCSVLLPTKKGHYYLVMENGIYEIDRRDRVERVATAPVQIFNTGTIHRDRLYFSSGPNLWSWKVPFGAETTKK